MAYHPHGNQEASIVGFQEEASIFYNTFLFTQLQKTRTIGPSEPREKHPKTQGKGLK